MIKKQLNIDVRNSDEETGLSIACWKCCEAEVVLELIEMGADINNQDSEDVTPFIYAVVFGHNEVVLALLKAGA